MMLRRMKKRESDSSIDFVGNDGENLKGQGAADDHEIMEDEDENLGDEHDILVDKMNGEEVCELNLDIISYLQSIQSLV